MKYYISSFSNELIKNGYMNNRNTLNQGSYTKLAIKFKGFQGFSRVFKLPFSRVTQCIIHSPSLPNQSNKGPIIPYKGVYM